MRSFWMRMQHDAKVKLLAAAGTVAFLFGTSPFWTRLTALRNPSGPFTGSPYSPTSTRSTNNHANTHANSSQTITLALTNTQSTLHASNVPAIQHAADDQLDAQQRNTAPQKPLPNIGTFSLLGLQRALFRNASRVADFSPFPALWRRAAKHLSPQQHLVTPLLTAPSSTARLLTAPLPPRAIMPATVPQSQYRIFQLFPFSVIVETKAKLYGASSELNQLPTNKNKLSPISSIPELLKKNPHGFTTSRGAHVQLSLQPNGSLEADIDLPKTQGRLRDMTAQHIRDAMMLLLQSGNNYFTLKKDEYSTAKIGFVLAWANYFESKSKQPLKHNFRIQLHDPKSNTAQQIDMISDDVKGGVSIYPASAFTDALAESYDSHADWIEAEMDSQGKYRTLMDLVESAWANNCHHLAQQCLTQQQDTTPTAPTYRC